MGEFEWPWEYSFPPFFTLQPNEKTREQQFSVWRNLILKYCKQKNQALINVNEDSELFSNKSIDRELPLKVRNLIFEELCKTGNAGPIDKKRGQWEVYWHTLDEWAKLIYNWAVETGQTNTVCTLFEISNGDNSIGQEFHQLDTEIILKALRHLESQDKCELMLYDDSQGVKFF
uniref:Vacuolar protein-sorting-associated protein 25 n=1 Tax=Tabanus bromius TaxID=304241 RepID=A0A0K8TNG0_TABBR